MRVGSSMVLAAAVVLGACSVRSPEVASVPAPTSEPTSDEIEAAMDRVIGSSDSELFVFGGDVATCQALRCPQPDRIYHGAATDRWLQADTSGFELVGERNAVLLAEKEGESQTALGTISSRALGGWMRYTVFRIDVAVESITFQGTSADHVRYELFSTGDATGTNPVAPGAGAATWSGAMAGIVIPAGTELDGAFVSGDARITLHGLDAGAPPTVDVAFSDIVNERTGASLRDMAWEGVAVADGTFASPRFVAPIEPSDVDVRDDALVAGILGRFHGPGHEEAGGVFIRDGVSGAFAAGRDE